MDRQTNVKITTSCCLVHVEEEEAASCPDLTVLLQKDDHTVVNLKLTVVLQTPHLCDNTGSHDQFHTQTRQLSSAAASRGSHLDVEALWWLHVLRYVQTFVSSHRAHEGSQRLLILTEPRQLHTHRHQQLAGCFLGPTTQKEVMSHSPPLHTCGSGRWRAAHCRTPSAVPESSAGGRTCRRGGGGVDLELKKHSRSHEHR